MGKSWPNWSTKKTLAKVRLIDQPRKILGWCVYRILINPGFFWTGQFGESLPGFINYTSVTVAYICRPWFFEDKIFLWCHLAQLIIIFYLKFSSKMRFKKNDVPNARIYLLIKVSLIFLLFIHKYFTRLLHNLSVKSGIFTDFFTIFLVQLELCLQKINKLKV